MSSNGGLSGYPWKWRRQKSSISRSSTTTLQTPSARSTRSWRTRSNLPEGGPDNLNYPRCNNQGKVTMPLRPLDIEKLSGKAENIYEAIVILLKRARQINEEMKIEFNQRIEMLQSRIFEPEEETE